VRSGKFVRAVILPLCGKDRLSGKGRKRLKETRLVVGKFPYKLLNGDVVFPYPTINMPTSDTKKVVSRHKSRLMMPVVTKTFHH
jgi:hypothetical protein